METTCSDLNHKESFFLFCLTPHTLQVLLIFGLVMIRFNLGVEWLKRIFFYCLAENLLLTADHKTVKLADFGLAREESLTEMMTAETGTYRWMAPEVLLSF